MLRAGRAPRELSESLGVSQQMLRHRRRQDSFRSPRTRRGVLGRRARCVRGRRARRLRAADRARSASTPRTASRAGTREWTASRPAPGALTLAVPPVREIVRMPGGGAHAPDAGAAAAARPRPAGASFACPAKLRRRPRPALPCETLKRAGAAERRVLYPSNMGTSRAHRRGRCWNRAPTQGRSLLPLPHCDSDGARAPSDRDLARRGRRAYAADATGPAEWRFCCSSAASACSAFAATTACPVQGERLVGGSGAPGRVPHGIAERDPR
jgi:hypothetical protein